MPSAFMDSVRHFVQGMDKSATPGESPSSRLRTGGSVGKSRHRSAGSGSPSWLEDCSACPSSACRPSLSLHPGNSSVDNLSPSESAATRLATNHTLSRLCGAPTAQAGITNGWTEYPSRSRSWQTVSTTYCCRLSHISLSSPNREVSLPISDSLPGCTIVRIPATFSPTTQEGCISRIARSISGQR